jgi:hypothetical protein
MKSKPQEENVAALLPKGAWLAFLRRHFMEFSAENWSIYMSITDDAPDACRCPSAPSAIDRDKCPRMLFPNYLTCLCVARYKDICKICSHARKQAEMKFSVFILAYIARAGMSRATIVLGKRHRNAI